jgi:hypothetical protein
VSVARDFCFEIFLVVPVVPQENTGPPIKARNKKALLRLLTLTSIYPLIFGSDDDLNLRDLWQLLPVALAEIGS